MKSINFLKCFRGNTLIMKISIFIKIFSLNYMTSYKFNPIRKFILKVIPPSLYDSKLNSSGYAEYA